MVSMEGNNVVLFYDDGASVAKKIGKIISKDNSFVVIRIDDKDVSIPTARIIRMEEDNND